MRDLAGSFYSQVLKTFSYDNIPGGSDILHFLFQVRESGFVKLPLSLRDAIPASVLSTV
jgi:hypothetical protein